MTRLGTIAFTIFGGAFGAVWAFAVGSDVRTIVVISIFAAILCGVIAYSWEPKEIGK